MLGLIHSMVGELRVFQSTNGLVSLAREGQLKTTHLHILRVSWHVVTVFGWGFGVILFWLSQADRASGLPFLGSTLGFIFLVAALLTLVGTRARHLGWIVLAVMAVLVRLA